MSLPNINARIVIHCEEKDNKVLLCAIRYPATVATPSHHTDRDTNYGVDVLWSRRCPTGHHPNLAVVLSEAKPTGCLPPLSLFPDRESSWALLMIPAETSVFASLSGGIASLNHRLSNDDALRATGFPGVTAEGKRDHRGYSGSSQMRLFRRWLRSYSNRDLCGFLSSREPRSQTASRAA